MIQTNLPRILTLSLLAALPLLAACGTPAPGTGGDTAGDQPVTGGLATVEGIDILILESFPVQVSVVVRGSLPDSCTEVDQISQELDAETNTFSIEITTARPPDATCAQVIGSFEETIALEVYGLPAGTYTVDANGVTGTFTLSTDNVLPED